MKKIIIIIMSLVFIAGVSNCKKKVKISEKSKLLFGKTWTYDAETSRKTALTKAGKTTGIKNLKDIKLKGDVKKGVDYLTHTTIKFFEDSKGRGIGYLKTIGKGFLKSKRSGWLYWNKDETEFTLKPWSKDGKLKPTTYKFIKADAHKLILLNKGSLTQTPEVYTR